MVNPSCATPKYPSTSRARATRRQDDSYDQFAANIRGCEREGPKTFVISGNYSDEYTHAEHCAAEYAPLKRREIESAVAGMGLHFQPGNQSTLQSYSEAILLLAPGNPFRGGSRAVYVDDIAEASPDCSAIFTIADDIFALPVPPVPRESRHSAPMAIRAKRQKQHTADTAESSRTAEELMVHLFPPHGLGPCLQVELGSRAPATLVREIGDCLLAIIKATSPHRYVTVTDASTAFYATRIRETARGFCNNAQFTYYHTLQHKLAGRAATHLCASTTDVLGRNLPFNKAADHISIGVADNDARAARQHFTIQ